MKKDNKILVDINKCQWAKFYYRNQYGQTSPVLPMFQSVRGEYVSSKDLALFHPLYPGESMLERAYRLELIDSWQPEITFKLTANECLVYTGDKAISMNELWKAKIFGKKKK